MLFYDKISDLSNQEKTLWNIKSYCPVKETRLKRLHTTWFSLYDILKNVKLETVKKISSCQDLGREGCTGREQGVYRKIDLFCVILTSCICPNPLNYTT